MKYISTRGNFRAVEAAEAIRTGMVPTGGLFVPEEIPVLSLTGIREMADKKYQEVALQVLEKFLTDYSREELIDSIQAAYDSRKFPVEDVVPVVGLTENLYLMELWHGPTAAFKDMALQLMPRLMMRAIKKAELRKDIVILVATSGDTGSAALEGFKNLEGVKIIVFYPAEGVSKIQELQMTTIDGDNTYVVGVKGNFDDCQSAVKAIFADQDVKDLLAANGFQFSSANSINWGRLVPQIVYYFSSYANLLKKDVLTEGEKINIVVPTGNFGNILAAYYAYKMGLPVNRFICASNDNNVLADFLSTGTYDIRRDFKRTISPSMDILISSNLERFLFEITGRDADKINKWYQELKEEGVFEIDARTLADIHAIFTGGFATEEETLKTIRESFDKYQYTLDPHTAVAVNVYEKYREESNDDTVTLLASTASPFKFAETVLQALGQISAGKNGEESLQELKKISGQEIHPALRDLGDKEPVHKRVASHDRLADEILDILQIRYTL
ncbi:MAG: threonine synthase [Halanaerobiales bacterium]